jgi:acyl dehydratase
MKVFRDDDRLYLDDLQIGQRFTSGTHVVDEKQIKAFARQFDPQPFHLDNEAAKNTLLSGLAASGWHTAAITIRLLVESGIPLAGGIVGAGGELEWPNPTRLTLIGRKIKTVKTDLFQPHRLYHSWRAVVARRSFFSSLISIKDAAVSRDGFKVAG